MIFLLKKLLVIFAYEIETV